MTTASTPATTALQREFEHELRTTRRLIERLPDDKLQWKPHVKSMSLGGLALHIANLVRWQSWTLRASELDLAAAPPSLGDPAGRDEVLRAFDENVAELTQAFAGADDAAMQQPWTLRRGEQTLMKMPRMAIMRSMGLNHIVHHRGQLSVYLRLLDVPVPSIYGPSADEAPSF